MSVVRRATADDVPALVRMGRAFIASSEHGRTLSVDDAALADRVSALVASDDVAWFVADRDGDVCAMLVCAVMGLWFAPSTMMATELAWWVEPRARGTTVAVRLVKAYEEWARAAGVSVCTMSSLDGCNGAQVATMLARMGYARSETTHIKEMTRCHSSQH